MTARSGEGVIKVRRRCPRCSGEGLIDFAHCDACGQGLAADDPWWERDDAYLPCGHEAAGHLASRARCPVCEGHGQIVEPLSETEYHSRQRKRYARGLFLLLLAVIPFALLTAAILTAEPANVCGSWWYGVGLLLLGFWMR